MDIRLPRPRTRPIRAVTTELLLDYYDAAVREPDIMKIAAAMDLDHRVLQGWIEKFPELQLARKKAEERRDKGTPFSDYVFRHLSPEAREVWRKIEFWSDNDLSGHQKVEEILGGISLRARQDLFIHALSISWNPSEACRLTHTPKGTFETWKVRDMGFRQLILEMEWHRKNWIESKLNGLVENDHPQAIIFTNRTLNADRGYNEKLQVEHSGSVESGVDLFALDLDPDTKRKILDAIRKKNLETHTDRLAQANAVTLAAT